MCGGMPRGDRKLLKQLIYRVRQKIDSAGDGQPYIATIPGVGYAIAKQGDAAAD